MIIEKFHFYTLDEKKPQPHVPVLCKVNFKDCPYYVCYMLEYRNTLNDKIDKRVFIEAMGEEYMQFDEGNIVAWASIGTETL